MTNAVAVNPAYRVWHNLDPDLRAKNIEHVIKRVVNDEKLADIAADLNLSRSALNMALLEFAEDDWKRAQVARAMTRLQNAQIERESATDVLTLVRARDAEKSAQWELERTCRRIYGQDQPPAGVNAVQININLRRDQAQAVEVKDITPDS